MREAVRDWPGETQDRIEELKEARQSCEDSEKDMAQQFDEFMSDQQEDTHIERQRKKELWDELKRAKYER